jgi:uncharacterized repeat protein (TIGR02543 family)
MKQITKSLMRFVFTIALLFGSASVWAQYYMDVTTKDGERILIPVADVNEVQIVNESDYHKPNGEHNGYEYVDLGLSIMWATCNVGANNPEEGGDYFARGEVTPKETYTNENYKFLSNNIITKYCSSSDQGIVDNKTTLDKCDDAARYNMGGSWRMPTLSEYEELVNNCSWSYTTHNGVEGYRAFSKINGNSIFFPITVTPDSIYSDYWSSTLFKKTPIAAYIFRNCDGIDINGAIARHSASSVRAVYSATANIPTTSTLTFDANGGSGDMPSITIWSDDNSHSVAIPYNIDIIVRKNYKFIGWNTASDGNGISYSDGDSIEITQDITLYAQWEELVPLDEAFYLALDGKTVKLTESLGSQAETSYGALVNVMNKEDIPTEKIEQMGMVNFNFEDYICLQLTYNWYGFGLDCKYYIFINRYDYSVFAPAQFVADIDEDLVTSLLGSNYGPGKFQFANFEGELDSQTNTLTFQNLAAITVSAGNANFGTDYYKIEFEEEAQSPLEAFFTSLDGKTVRMTESVGSEYEAAYGALVTLLSEEDIINAGVVQDGFTAADYIGLRLTYNWYSYGVNCNYCIYINKKDYSVSAPSQIVGDVSAEIILNYIFGTDYGPGNFQFANFTGEFDTETNVLTFQHDAYINVSVGSGSFGSDTYKVEFGEIL